MEEELFTLKPSVINALVPVFFKNLIYALLFLAVAFGLFWLLITFGTVDYKIEELVTWAVLFMIVFPTVPTLLRLLILYNSKYIFFKTYVVSEFEFIKVKRYSVPFHQTVKVTSNVSIWDRICGAGDITMHTAEDTLPDLTLYYIKNPEKIETKIYELIQENKHGVPTI